MAIIHKIVSRNMVIGLIMLIFWWYNPETLIKSNFQKDFSETLLNLLLRLFLEFTYWIEVCLKGQIFYSHCCIKCPQTLQVKALFIHQDKSVSRT